MVYDSVLIALICGLVVDSTKMLGGLKQGNGIRIWKYIRKLSLTIIFPMHFSHFCMYSNQ